MELDISDVFDQLVDGDAFFEDCQPVVDLVAENSTVLELDDLTIIQIQTIVCFVIAADRARQEA